MGDILMNVALFVGVLFAALFALGMIFARLYTRATKEQTFVRTGFGGQKVIRDGGALVFPVLHDIKWVNMNTLRLEVRRANEQALITKDRMRVDVTAEFYVRVKPDAEAIATAAQTLGDRTMRPEDLKTLVEGKFVDALRAVAAGMAMEQLHENRVEFVQHVQRTVAEDLNKNGLELEAVSLTGLDQTARQYFNPDNAFDAEGLTKLTQEIEERRKKRNDIEQDTRIQIERKNLESERYSLSIRQDQEFATLEQEREVENRRAEQQAEIRRVAAEKRREAEEADVVSERQVLLAKIEKDRQTREKDIEKERLLREREIEKEQAIELAKQGRDIAVSERSKDESRARGEADRARAEAVLEEERVLTVRQTAEAERRKEVMLIQAKEDAEKEAIGMRIVAEAEKVAARDRADAVLTAAEAEAAATRAKYDAEAQGTLALNEARNVLTAAQINMAINLALIERLPEIIRESVKPAEKIDSIKIFDLKGLNGLATGGSVSGVNGAGTGFADDLVGGLLKYQMMSPLAQQILKEAGLEGVTPENLLKGGAPVLRPGAEPLNGAADRAAPAITAPDGDALEAAG
ncbi:flotillin family protein [Ectothiorhodospiraceae bacterium 2226]|nr:flotillin family protein [Ectothiorhodospiraceae bacterium 2226]